MNTNTIVGIIIFGSLILYIIYLMLKKRKK